MNLHSRHRRAGSLATALAVASVLAGMAAPAAALRVPPDVPVADLWAAPGAPLATSAASSPAKSPARTAAAQATKAAKAAPRRKPAADSAADSAAVKAPAQRVAGKPQTGAAVAVAGAALSASARSLQRWVQITGDNEGAPFAVIDKQRARVWIFESDGRVAGSSPVLLGAARGDVSVPGIGERPIKDILPHERTTPAGRFIAEPGHNAAGDDIIWVDYDAAVSMHRVRANNVAERRLQRLASVTAADNRISYGCINVPADFYDAHIRDRFQQHHAVIYLLPETRPLATLFNTAQGLTPALTPPFTPALTPALTPVPKGTLTRSLRLPVTTTALRAKTTKPL